MNSQEQAFIVDWITLRQEDLRKVYSVDRQKSRRQSSPNGLNILSTVLGDTEVYYYHIVKF